MKELVSIRVHHWCLPVLLSIALAPFPLLAQDADPEARAETIIDGLLENLHMTIGELNLQIAEEYELTQEGDAFIAEFDPVTLGEENGLASLGPVSITVTPGEEGLSEVSIEIADAVVFLENDTEVGRINIGEQSAEGIWSDTLNAFASSNFQLVDLSLEVTDEPVEAGLSRLSFDAKLVTADDQTWTQETSIEALAFSLSGPEGQQVSIGSISAGGDVEGSDYAEFMSFAESLQELFSPEELEKAEDDPTAIIAALTELYGYVQSFEGSFSLADLSVSQGDTPLGALASLSFGANFDTADDGSSFSYNVAFEGLDTPMAPLPPALLPNAMRFEIGLENIPAGLIEKVGEVAAASESMSAGEQQAMMSQELLGMVMSSALGAYIRDTFIAAPESRVDLGLEAQVAVGSPFGATGQMNLKIIGLDTAVQGAGLDQDPEIAPALAMLTAFSNRSEEDGKVVDSFALEVTTDGKLMLNGKDMTAMMMGGGAAPGPEPSDSTETAEEAPAQQ